MGNTHTGKALYRPISSNKYMYNILKKEFRVTLNS
jgi:hypothetical protein